MKKLIAAAALLVATTAQAAVVTYHTKFEPEGGGGRTGTGSAIASFDDVSNVFTFFSDFSGLSGLTTAAHFHCCTTTPFAGTAGVAYGSNGAGFGFAGTSGAAYGSSGAGFGFEGTSGAAYGSSGVLVGLPSAKAWCATDVNKNVATTAQRHWRRGRRPPD